MLRRRYSPAYPVLGLGDDPGGHAPPDRPFLDGSFDVEAEDEDEPCPHGLARRDRESGTEQETEVLVLEGLDEGDLDRDREDDRHEDRIPEGQEHVDPGRIVRVEQDLNEVDHDFRRRIRWGL